MAELFELLKKTNPNLDITFDKKTNTVKVNNSEEDIEKNKKTEPNKPQITPVIRTQYRRIGSGRWSGSRR